MDPQGSGISPGDSAAPAPADRLVAIIQAIRHNRPLPADLADWLAQGVADYLTGNGTLDTALGLAGSGGKRTARVQFQQAARDRWLCAAWGLCQGASPWARSVALEGAVRRFESVIWPRWRDMDTPPEGASYLRRALFGAFQSGAPVPTTARRLHAICTETSSPF